MATIFYINVVIKQSNFQYLMAVKSFIKKTVA